MNNIQARSRDDRNQFSSRDFIEQEYINKRQGYEARHLDAKNLIYNSDIKTTLHCSEIERFDKDFAHKEKQNRESRFQNVQNYFDDHRKVCLDRETYKWNNYHRIVEQQQFQDHEDKNRIQLKSQAIFNGKRNLNYQGFNPITNRYENNSFGQLKYEDDQNQQVKYLVRQSNFQQKNNQNFNILNGEKKNPYSIPMMLQDKYNQGIQQQNNFYNSFKSNKV